jgi:hypothetical protein
MKKCGLCRIEKELEDFYREPNGAQGVRGRCKACDSKRNKKYRAEHAERLKEYDRGKYENRRGYYLLHSKNYYAANAEQISQKLRVWRQSPDGRAFKKLYRQSELAKPKYRFHQRVRLGIYNAFRRHRISKRYPTFPLLGYSKQELFRHMERQFLAGMNWENYGSKWHIDHIRPLSSFDLSDEKQIIQAYALHNLRPLWAFENISKKNKITHLI